MIQTALSVDCIYKKIIALVCMQLPGLMFLAMFCYLLLLLLLCVFFFDYLHLHSPDCILKTAHKSMSNDTSQG